MRGKLARVSSRVFFLLKTLKTNPLSKTLFLLFGKKHHHHHRHNIIIIIIIIIITYIATTSSCRSVVESNGGNVAAAFSRSKSFSRCLSRRRFLVDPRMDSPWTSGLTKPSAFLRYDDGASLLPFEGHIELGDDDDDVFCARLFDRCLSLSLSLAFPFP